MGDPRPTVRAVFLDAGLTLLRPDPSLGATYSRVTASHGVAVDAATFEEAAARAFHVVARDHRDGGDEGMRTSEGLERASWHRHAGMVKDALPSMATVPFEPWFEDLYDAFGSPRAWKPYDDAVPTLDALEARGVRLVVVSNWDRRLHDILEAHGIRRRFHEVVVSSEIGWRKPHPGIFRRALEAAGVAPAEALHVGDSRGDDYDGARALGIGALLLVREGDSPPGVDAVRGLGEILPRVGRK
jgi:putative hydrolase of the HAD superfamily